MIRFDDACRTLSLGVLDLLDAGTPWGVQATMPTARTRLEAGRLEHTAWREGRRKGDQDFRGEVPVSYVTQVAGWRCRVAGRLDGLSREGDRLVVEEVKSCGLPRERLDALVANDLGDWTRQLRLYLHFLEMDGKGPLAGRLVLRSLADGWQRILHVGPDPGMGEAIGRHLLHLVRLREDWLAHRGRLVGMDVVFPYATWRAGQFEMAGAVQDALRVGRHLLLEAPTGVGKTAAVLHGAIRAAVEGGRRLFFATARTTQQRLVEQTLGAMAGHYPLRAVVLRAREKACLNQGLTCHPEHCAHARGYGDRLRDGRVLESLLEHGVLTADLISAVGRDATLCPYQLALDLVPQVDVVVGDYNYFFDPDVVSGRLFGEGMEPWSLVVDEAHNLPDRARGWFSARIGQEEAQVACRALRARGVALEPWAALAEDVAWLLQDAGRYVRDQDGVGGFAGRTGSPGACVVDVPASDWLGLLARMDELATAYVAHQEPLSSDRPPAGMPRDPYVELHRAVQRFCSRLEVAGDETLPVFLPSRGTGGRAELTLFCRDPSPHLARRFSVASGAVCMSATLRPERFFLDVLGLPAEDTSGLRLPSPFDPANLEVLLAGAVSTRFRDRARDREETAALVEEAIQAVPGNSAVLFSSFALMDSLVPLLDLGGRRVLRQTPGMTETQRDAILEELSAGGRDDDLPPRVLLGVLGGIFSEGIDLPGDALLAAVIVGPGLPAVSWEQEAIRDWYERRNGHGFLYAYLAPGMVRVVQAAGRVVRTPTDRGVVVLVDERFQRRDFGAFFPATWTPRAVPGPGPAVASFFGRGTEAQGSVGGTCQDCMEAP